MRLLWSSGTTSATVPSATRSRNEARFGSGIPLPANQLDAYEEVACRAGRRLRRSRPASAIESGWDDLETKLAIGIAVQAIVTYLLPNEKTPVVPACETRPPAL